VPETPVRVAIHVRPGASTTRVGGEHAGALVVRVTAPAEHGKATAAALDALADALSLPRRTVTLVTGATSRRKIVAIDLPGPDAPALRRTIERLRAG
jgi:uncharacterized protein YggU (UPF0235/DUF167 family)